MVTSSIHVCAALRLSHSICNRMRHGSNILTQHVAISDNPRGPRALSHPDFSIHEHILKLLFFSDSIQSSQAMSQTIRMKRDSHASDPSLVMSIPTRSSQRRCLTRPAWQRRSTVQCSVHLQRRPSSHCGRSMQLEDNP
jgi:hypothetical protein